METMSTPKAGQDCTVQEHAVNPCQGSGQVHVTWRNGMFSGVPGEEGSGWYHGKAGQGRQDKVSGEVPTWVVGTQYIFPFHKKSAPSHEQSRHTNTGPIKQALMARLK